MKRSFVVNVAGGFVGFILALLVLSVASNANALSLNRPADVQAPASIVSAPSTTSISGTFTYQGQLKTGGSPVNGSCNMAFRLYDDPAAGSLIGSPITLTTVSIVNGYFTVGLNFGNSAFAGSARWLDIRVRCPAGSGSFTTLTPRQAVTAAPYALAPWVTSGSTLYYNSGNVGIGTTNPSASLSVVESGALEPTAYGVPVGLKVGTSEGTIPFAVRQNTAESSTPGLALFETSDGNLGGFGANVDTFIVSAAASHGLGFNVDGSIRAMTVLTNGSIGIGTIPCAYAKLHVYTGSSGYACGSAAVRGESSSDYGVDGVSGNSIGVDGVSITSIGVYGQSNSSTGVIGDSLSGTYIFEGYDRGASYNLRFAVVRATGNVLADGSFTSPADFAEMMSVKGLKDDYTPGDVLVIGLDGKLMLSNTPNATNLVGVYSAKPGFLGDTEIAAHGIEYYDSPSTQERIAVALLGIVPVKVTAQNGQIQPGDLLTTSSTPGHAMKAKPVIINGVAIYPTGTILGKALESWQQGNGVIKVLITLR